MSDSLSMVWYVASSHVGVKVVSMSEQHGRSEKRNNLVRTRACYWDRHRCRQSQDGPRSLAF